MKHMLRDSRSKEKIYELLIIGGGPAGLSAAYHAKRTQIDYRVLDKGSAAESWLNMSRFFSLITPMWTNFLPGDHFYLNPFKRISCKDYGRYASSYAKRKKLNVLENTEVLKITKRDRVFTVSTENGPLLARSIVFATGYYSTPNIPSVFKYENQEVFRVFHAKEVDNHYANLSPDNGAVLIIGKRNTAGQIAAQLLKDQFQVSFSVRSELEFRKDDTLLGKIKEFLYFFKEHVVIRFRPNLKQNSYPPMDATGVKEFYDKGEIDIYSEVVNIKGREVCFKNGTKAEFAAIILATGYTFTNLEVEQGDRRDSFPEGLSKNDCVKQTEGVFYIGKDNQINFRSRYLRGIRNDSKILINQVANYLSNE